MLKPNQRANHGSDKKLSDAEGDHHNAMARKERVLLFEDPMLSGSINFIQP